MDTDVVDLVAALLVMATASAGPRLDAQPNRGTLVLEWLEYRKLILAAAKVAAVEE